MKKFLLLIISSGALFLASAQSTNLQLKTTNGKLVNYGKVKTGTTTDSTLSVWDTLAIKNNSAGILEVTVVATDSLGDGVTGKVIYRYHKSAGTLTLASGTNISAAVTDSGLGTSTWTFTATSSNNVQLKVKGKLTYTVHWRTLIVQTWP